MEYQLKDFDYELPESLIAQEPARPRDAARLLVLDRKDSSIEHKRFYDIADYLEPGDVLVVNDSKVFPARLLGKKEGSGGRIEILLHQDKGDMVWECLVGGRVHENIQVVFPGKLRAELLSDNGDGTWLVRFNLAGQEFFKAIEKIGRLPLPPYIKRNEALEKDKHSYQTVYADDAKVGSAAAPTAGLHFTDRLLKKIEAKGVIIERVTLHVGLGTFAPVKVDDISKHKMHSEYAQIAPAVAKRLNRAKEAGRRIIAVGTTSCRTLESWGQAGCPDQGFAAWTSIFITPGYRFRVVDALITNFHLPKSTLMMLVSALAGKEAIDKAYKEAVSLEYHFFSYGDAMFIH